MFDYLLDSRYMQNINVDHNILEGMQTHKMMEPWDTRKQKHLFIKN